MREETIRFETFDYASDGTVRPSAVLRRLQTIGQDDLNDLGVTYLGLKERGIAFVVSRMALFFARPVPGDRDLSLTTAAGAVRGVAFPRTFLLRDEAGPVLYAKSIWALLDLEKRVLLRPSALGVSYPAWEDLAPSFSCARLTVPKEGEALWRDTRRVYASMLDRNDHLNNCHYADLATDLLPPDFGAPAEMHITFQHEARRGDVLTLSGYPDENGALIVGGFAEREETCFLCLVRKR